MNEALTLPKNDLGFEELLPEPERDGAYDPNRAGPGVLTCHKICQKTPPLVAGMNGRKSLETGKDWKSIPAIRMSEALPAVT